MRRAAFHGGTQLRIFEGIRRFSEDLDFALVANGKGVATDDAWVGDQLLDVIGKIDWTTARRDVLPFVYASDRPSVELWNAEFFSAIVQKTFKQ